MKEPPAPLASFGRRPAVRAFGSWIYAHDLVTPNRLARTTGGLSLALCVALSVGACGAAGDVASAARPEETSASAVPSASESGVTPFVLPSRTGKTLSRAGAARRYLEIVGPRNDAMTAYYDAVDAHRPWTEVRDLAAALLAAEDEEVRQLAGTPWPADVIPFADALARENLSRRPGWAAMAAAPSEGRFVRGMELLARLPRDSGETSYRIRDLLGLLSGSTNPWSPVDPSGSADSTDPPSPSA